MHVHNLSPDNLAGREGEVANRAIYRQTEKSFPPDKRFDSYDAFARTWSIEELHRVVFEESETDYAMAQAVPLFDFWKDGLAAVERQHALKAAYPDRALFCGSVDPSYQGVAGALASMEHQVNELGACSMKFYNAHTRGRSWRCDDRDVAYPLYERALELGVSVFQFHKGLALGLEPLQDLTPTDLQRPALDFPDANFIIHHLALPYEAEAIDIARRFPNVYLSLSSWINLFFTQPVPTMHRLGKALLNCGAGKIIYGSEAPLWPSTKLLIDYLLEVQFPDPIQDEYGYPEITEDMRRAIMGENLAGLLKLDLESGLGK